MPERKYEPATDEVIEYWRIQVTEGAGAVLSITRAHLGAILARLAEAEDEVRPGDKVVVLGLNGEWGTDVFSVISLGGDDRPPDVPDGMCLIQPEGCVQRYWIALDRVKKVRA